MTKFGFRRNDGKLSVYALSCGYIEEYEKNDIYVRLYMENGCPDPYNVISHDRKGNKRLDWQVFDKISDARKDFNRQIREGEQHGQ